MDSEKLRSLLWEKAAKEQSDYVENLQRLPPYEIISHSYEKVMRDDILLTFEDDYLSDEKVAALIKLDYPLAACYNEWLGNDCSYMDMLRDTVENYADHLIEEREKRNTQKKKYEMER